VIDDVYFLTIEEVVAIHADKIARYGNPGLRDRGLLESGVHAARNVKDRTIIGTGATRPWQRRTRSTKTD